MEEFMKYYNKFYPNATPSTPFVEEKTPIDSNSRFIVPWKLDDKTYYFGEMEESQRNRSNKGKLVTEDFCYEGEFKNNLFHGKGIQIFKDNSTYDGTFF